VNILLQALDRAGKKVHYYALDLNINELERTLADIPPGTFKNVTCSGLHGTYDDGLEWLKSPEMAAKPKTVLWLGSSIGNFKRHEAGPFLSSFAQTFQPGDMMLIGIDACNDPKKIFHAYNDSEGLTHKFILNGLVHANRLDTKVKFNLEDWEVIGEYMYDSRGGRHHALVSPTRDVVVDGVEVMKGERIRIEESYKYSPLETQRLWEKTGFVESTKWSNRSEDYGKVLSMRFTVPNERSGHVANPRRPNHAQLRRRELTVICGSGWQLLTGSRTSHGRETEGFICAESRVLCTEPCCQFG
jgi:L-histidine Nalpha-methyltransferase / hercynylcysteine S-oxide synthase